MHNSREILYSFLFENFKFESGIAQQIRIWISKFKFKLACSEKNAIFGEEGNKGLDASVVS